MNTKIIIKRSEMAIEKSNLQCVRKVLASLDRSKCDMRITYFINAFWKFKGLHRHHKRNVSQFFFLLFHKKMIGKSLLLTDFMRETQKNQPFFENCYLCRKIVLIQLKIICSIYELQLEFNGCKLSISNDDINSKRVDGKRIPKDVMTK